MLGQARATNVISSSDFVASFSSSRLLLSLGPRTPLLSITTHSFPPREIKRLDCAFPSSLGRGRQSSKHSRTRYIASLWRVQLQSLCSLSYVCIPATTLHDDGVTGWKHDLPNETLLLHSDAAPSNISLRWWPTTSQSASSYRIRQGHLRFASSMPSSPFPLPSLPFAYGHLLVICATPAAFLPPFCLLLISGQRSVLVNVALQMYGHFISISLSRSSTLKALVHWAVAAADRS